MTAPRTDPPVVGNDVVDTGHPRCVGKSDDHRFLSRVLAPEELATVRAAADRDRCLWLHWAAKEAAFKAATVARGEPPVFEHAAFRVTISDGGTGEGDAVGPDGWAGSAGVVRWRELEIAWREWGTVPTGGIHVVSWVGPGGEPPGLHGWAETLPEGYRIPRDRLSAAELRGVHSEASARVRLRAREELARLAGVDESDLEIVTREGPPGRTPPEVLLRGEPWEWRVGISHHGRLVGWVLARDGA